MYVCIVFAILHMKRACLLQLVLVLLLVSVQVPGAHADLGHVNDGDVTFTKVTTLPYPDDYLYVGDLVNHNEPTIVTGEIGMYNDATYIYIRASVFVWVKPYLAFSTSELEAFDGSGVLDKISLDKHGNYKKDKNKDGTVDKHDLKSDGIYIFGLGDPYLHVDNEKGYRWRVDSDSSDLPSKDRRDPEFYVPSWDETVYPDGIVEEQIIYEAKIPISVVEGAGITSPWNIIFEVHVSPHAEIPEVIIPELPLGTLSAVFTMLAALVLFSRLQ